MEPTADEFGVQGSGFAEPVGLQEPLPAVLATAGVCGAVAAAAGPIGGAKNPIGYGMCAPAIVTHGTDDQKRLLRPLFSNEHIWCQLFSEPGAGSDVASLAMKADRDGDEWIVNGQKVWTTLAHISRYGLAICRTDPDLPKHRGITAFIVDMEAEGVEVRPLRQMTGEAEFNEVYFTDVRIPDSMRVDEVGRGRRVDDQSRAWRRAAWSACVATCRSATPSPSAEMSPSSREAIAAGVPDSRICSPTDAAMLGTDSKRGS